MKILITGGAGFVGSRLALLWKEKIPAAQITCFDNLKRRGSELNLPTLKSHGIEFVHGDIRNPEDFEMLTGNFDLMIEASAEPSVQAGDTGSPLYVIQTNLGGAVQCLEFARKRCGFVVFLSSSRVYSIPALTSLDLEPGKTRLELASIRGKRGISNDGINEDFSTGQYRSFYGTTKLAGELLLEEYNRSYGLKGVINRCGVLCGEGQMGKTDQGVFTLWVARHFFGGALSYTGFGGKGLQVRDLLHPEDLFALLYKQVEQQATEVHTYNVGGGNKVSTSLLEYTALCENATGKKISIGSKPETLRT
ncbi:MAG TPA: NAD-dependent epimerase/dehydratase family protein, partial [Bdellovibrionota bacterium]